MKKLLKSVIVFVLSMFAFAISFGLDVTLPQPSANEVYQSGGSASADDDFWVNIINIVTKYLWVTLAVVSLGALARGGFLLIMAQGEEAEFKKANHILIYAVIGIIIAILSYVITQVVVNLF